MSEATGEFLILTLDTRGDAQPSSRCPEDLPTRDTRQLVAALHGFERFVRDQSVPSVGIDDCWSVAAELVETAEALKG